MHKYVNRKILIGKTIIALHKKKVLAINPAIRRIKVQTIAMMLLQIYLKIKIIGVTQNDLFIFIFFQ
jgi:hypothetical protein